MMFHFDRIQQRMFIIMAAIIIILSGALLLREYQHYTDRPLITGQQLWEEQPEDITKQDIVTEPEVDENKLITIYLTGQIKYPGIIELEEGARIAAAIEQAGGSLPDADLNRVNLALKVKDEGMYYIPSRGEEIPESFATTEANTEVSAVDGKININNADQTQLETLNGIGSVKALKIIEYREKNGEFKIIEEIMNVSGIGEKTFDGLKDQIDIH